MGTDNTDKKWIVVRIDDRIAGVSTDYRILASISAHLSRMSNKIFDNITATSVGIEEVWKLKQEIKWDDLMLFGTDFQKKVWRKLWELTHTADGPDETTCRRDEATYGQEGGTYGRRKSEIKLISYSDFAEMCQNRAGVRAVAHAIGLNPVSLIIPCHLVIPKESIDKINEIHKKAESTIFKGDDLCLDSILKDESIDFGEYALGRKMKRKLITMEIVGR